MDAPKDHDLVLQVYARLSVNPGMTGGDVELILGCTDRNSECLWMIDAPVNEAGELVVVFTPELLAELNDSHDKYWNDAWNGEGWFFHGQVETVIPDVLVSTTG